MMQRFVSLVALLALIVGLVVLTAPQRDAAAPPASGAPLHAPGYSALQARLVQTGADGRPLYTLDAASIQQQPDSDIIDLQQVQLGFHDTSGDKWTARAVHGTVAQDSRVVQLDGNVRVAGVLPGSGETAQIDTQHLSFDTNAQIVTTQDPVTILMSGRQLQSQGLVASLKERHVQLESAVHGSFLP
jgi:LPS export ABC transporter protein LptC